MAEYIEREALMKNFCGYDLTKCVKYGNKDADQRHNRYSTMMMYEIADEIIDAPTADVAPVRHGKWDGNTCTACKLPWDYNMTQNAQDWGYFDPMPDYCPNCGARMDGDTHG